MAGDKKRSNYPAIYLIRVDALLKKKLISLGSKKVRKYLEELLKK